MRAFFGLPCHMRKVISEVSEEKLSPSSGWLNVSEADVEETGRKELAFCKGRIYTSDWPKHLPISYYSFYLLQQPPEPDWVSLKTQSFCSAETSAEVLATQFETACQINSQHLNSYSWGNLKTCCVNELFTVLAVCPIAVDRWHWPCEVEWQRNKVSLPYIQMECPSTFVTARSALI